MINYRQETKQKKTLDMKYPDIWTQLKTVVPGVIRYPYKWSKKSKKSNIKSNNLTHSREEELRPIAQKALWPVVDDEEKKKRERNRKIALTNENKKQNKRRWKQAVKLENPRENLVTTLQWIKLTLATETEHGLRGRARYEILPGGNEGASACVRASVFNQCGDRNTGGLKGGWGISGFGGI